jgi:hypothetical protein
MKRIAVNSTTLDPSYSFFAPLTALAWRRIGYESLMFLVGTEAEWRRDRRACLVLDETLQLAQVVFVARRPAAADFTLSQVVRLCALDGDPDDYLLVSDVDMWPLSRGWLDRADPSRDFHVFNADAYGANADRFPICYLGGRRDAWRRAFGGGSLTEQLARVNWPAHSDWHFDERFATGCLRGLPDWQRRCQLLPRLAGTRLDRAAWHRTESLDGLVDAHLPRPGFVELHWSRLRALLQLLLTGDEFARAVDYHRRYVETPVSYDDLEEWFRRWFREFPRYAPEPYRSYGGYGNGEPNGTACSVEAIRAFARLVEEPNAVILNAGAGASSFLLRRLFKNVVCVDEDAHYLDIVRRTCLENGLDGSHFIVGLEDAPAADYTFYDYGEINEQARLGHYSLAWRKTRRAIYFDDADDRPHAFPHYRRLVLDFAASQGAAAEDCRDARDRYGRWGVIVRKPPPDRRGIISFSLWGDAPIYRCGAIENVRLAAVHYPGWRVRIYTDNPALIDDAAPGIAPLEVVRMPPNVGVHGMFWRFLAASDQQADAIIFRDCDSRLNAREASAVASWLASGRRFHVMRDHPHHADWPMLGGMWGVRGGVVDNMERRIAAWGVWREKLDDMRFLAERVWPEARLDMIHHSSTPTHLAPAEPFPPHPASAGFVGEITNVKGA